MKNLKNKLIIGTLGIISLSMITNTVFAVTGKAKGSVRIREQANTSSEVISLASDGEKVEVLAEENEWYKVKFENKTGYMSKDYVILEGELAVNTSTEVTNNEPNQPAENIQPEEQPPIVTNETPNETEKEPENTKSLVGTQITTKKEISIRGLPHFFSNSISNISKNVKLEVIQELNKWVKVTDGNVTGWVLKVSVDEDLKDETPNTGETVPVSTNPVDTDKNEPLKTGYINSERVNIRKAPDGEAIDVALKGDKAEILEETGDWYKVNINGRESGYIAKRLVNINN